MDDVILMMTAHSSPVAGRARVQACIKFGSMAWKHVIYNNMHTVSCNYMYVILF